jgi:glycosyltransferase involved in cell wall biosynthesis
VRILFFSHYFPPEVNAPANRTHEHCREWVAAGHEVHVVTCIPSHPFGTPYDGYRRRWYQSERVDGIHVHRVWTHLARNRGVLRRTLNFLSFIPTAAFRGLRLGSFDVVISTSPQFFCAVAAWVFTRLRRTPWVFELRDLWPDSIPAVGAMRKSFVLASLARLEMRMYRDASAVVCVTQGFVKLLQSRGIDGAKLFFVPNGIVPAFWESANRADARHQLQLDDDDVLASYVGTIGMAHGLATVLAAAGKLRAIAPNVTLLIVGDGAELDNLRAEAAREGLSNVRFTGMVSRDRVPAILAATDVALVTLKPSDVFKTVLPSKMFEAMAARCAIVLGVEGEARATLERAGAGVAVAPGDADALAATIAGLAADPARRGRMAAAGSQFVAREFSRHAWAARYIDVLDGVAARATAGEPVAVRSGE